MGDYPRILVAGAGPSGLSCAYWGAKKGYDITVFESNDKLSVKPCGELIPRETLRYTPFSSRAPWILNKVERGIVYYKGKYVRELRVDSLKGYTIDKRAFLEELAERAKTLGAKIRLGEKVTYNGLRKMGFDLAVDATGYRQNLARAAGLDYPTKKHVVTMQGYCKGKLESGAVVLNFYEKGYAWLFPRGDIVNFGVGGFYSKKMLEKILEDNLKIYGLKLLSSPAPILTTVELLGGPIKKIRKGKLVVVGEAAGAVLSTTGEGIRFALWSGSICLRENYERLFWRGYGKRLRFAGKLLNMVLKMSDEERFELLKRGSPNLQAKLLEGIRPSIKDLITIPWLLRYLGKL